MGFNLYLSNRSEVLAEELAKVVTTSPLPPLEKEVIVVQSQGMERWLTHQLSERLGIWANGWFPFPNLMIQQLFQTVLKENDPGLFFSSELLAWRLQRLLPTCFDQLGFESLKNYFRVGKHDLKLAQLCQRVADTFDQYTLYRPEMILRWEAGQDSHWQAQLWRKLVAENRSGHRAAIRQRFFETLQRSRSSVLNLPRRISLFGIPALPPFHLDVLVAVSQFVDVHLFLMNPSREFWADIVSEKELARKQQRQRSQYSLPFPKEHYFEVGNPLLASLGKLGKEFFGMLLDREGCVEWSEYHDPGEDTLLACLQSDILKLQHRGKDIDTKAVSPGDHSLQIHSCHSPMREMEVLHDQLLAFFDEHPTLMPHEILVMTPDIEAYAPYITAVFGREWEGEQRIPFSISDRSAKAESPAAQGFFKLLDLVGSRLGVSAVMDLLEMPVVQRRFGIRPEDRGQLLDWVRATRIRWGVDDEDREQQGVPAFQENSWRAGLDRLLLGYALPSSKGEPFADILPFDAVEGSSSHVLGQFLEFVEQLFERVRDLDRPRSLVGWSEGLAALLAQFFAEDEELEREFQIVRHQLKRLTEIQQESGFERPVPLEVIRYFLEKQLQITEFSRSFLAGGVTFCAMLPMRSIPFRVIALVGMDNATFPRSRRPLDFDLIASHPRPGDRSVREEDRYLFLEALLSARQSLHISYVGQSPRDNSEIPPSVLVSELIDVVEQGFTLAAEDRPIRQQVCIRHRLQAFSSAYFSGDPRASKRGPELFSYSRENLAALKARQTSDRTPESFVSTSIGEASPEFRRVELRGLKRFFKNPAKFLLRQRLGIVLEEGAALLEDREPFSLEALDAYKLRQELVDAALAGKAPSSRLSSVAGQGILPAGKSGELFFREMAVEAETFAESLRPLLMANPLPAVDLTIEVAGFQLTGRIDKIWPQHLLSYRCATAKAKDFVDVWIDHLALQCAGVTDYPRQSILLAQDRSWSFSPVDEARQILEQLLKFYWVGLSELLPFFPQSSLEYARARKLGKSAEDAIAAAGRVWNSSEGSRGEWSRSECNDVYYDLAFREINPLNDAFANVAIEIFGPLLSHQQVRNE